MVCDAVFFFGWVKVRHARCAARVGYSAGCIFLFFQKKMPSQRGRYEGIFSKTKKSSKAKP
jgi:hypothetical protein